MSAEVENMLCQLNETAKEYDESIYHDIDEVKLNQFRNWYSTRFKESLVPDSYIEIVSKINAFDFDGLSFYSLDENDENNIYESNEIYWENKNLKKYLFLGEDGISWFVYLTQKNKFLMLDKPSGSVLEKFTGADELFITAFESIL